MLQVNARNTARAATVCANESFAPKPTSQAPQSEETTFGALAARVHGELEAGQPFDPGVYLRESAGYVERRTGASLAGAAIKKLNKRPG